MNTVNPLQQADSDHYLHPFTDHKALGQKGTRIIEGAEGVYIIDDQGNRILDGMSGLWCVNMGYGRDELVTAAREQMERLPYYNSFFQCTHPPAVELATELAKVTPPGFEKVFYSCSGSEANDTVIRMVRHYWAQRGIPDRHIIIARENAYHGSTVGAASLGGMKPMHKQGGLPIPGIEHVPQPYYYGYEGDLDEAQFGIETAQTLAAKIEALGPDRVAAFIAEPIQGAGGVIIPPASYWPEIQRICDHYDILLVADEVITGFGRTGDWFGSQHFNINPDLIVIAKGLSSGYQPIGGVLVSDRVADVVIEGGEFYHGYTYSGHPVCCAVALANLQLMHREDIVATVSNSTAPYLARQWATLADHPIVGETRTRGMVGALELVQNKATKARFEPEGKAGALCRDYCVEAGVVMRHVGEGMIISPPLIITHEQIDELVTKARYALDMTARAMAEGV